jgi:nitrite reductase/ring-hydroxylating ferredoxin subunit
MKKIAKLEDIKKGGFLYFDHQGEKALLIRTRNDDLVAYFATCPHEGKTIMWDDQIDRILCECHMALFNVQDGSVYRTARDVEIKKGLRPIEIMVDQMKTVFVVD